MSTKKDVKSPIASVSKKKASTTTKSTSRKRDDSKDRTVTEKTEVSIKQSRVSKNEKKTDIKSTSRASAIKLTHPSTKESKSKSTTKLTPSSKKPVAPSSSRSTSRMGGPITPPSTRVTKTQYYPSKNLYSQALNHKENLIKTIDPSESKVSKKVENSKQKPEEKTKRKKVEEEPMSPDSSSMSERPRTATLRKGSIVNANIVGPDAPKLKLSKEIKPAIRVTPKPEEYNYEDDFESYESDFEAYSSSSPNSSVGDINLMSDSETSTSSISDNTLNRPTELRSAGKRGSSAGNDDERKLDSGTFDLPDYRHKQLLDNIKETIEKENAELLEKQINPASLSDEGFEDAKSLQFINFVGAQEKFKRRKSAEVRRRRGLEILSMIKMDTYDFTLFNFEPVPYEKFIQTYGKSNSVQTSIQTGEDDVSEEVQTDPINTVCTWTQYPVVFSRRNSSNTNFWKIYRSEYLGVGYDDVSIMSDETKPVNEEKLEKFISSAGNLMLRLLDESVENRLYNIKSNQKEIPFSQGFILLNANSDIYKKSTVKNAAFCSESNIFLTVHVNDCEDEFRSMVSVWDISSSQDPKFFLISFGEITCCTFGFQNSDLIFAGVNDGSILIWDLKYLNNKDNIIKCPNFSTDIDLGHSSSVIGIESITNTLELVLNINSPDESQICSLDEDGEIILWNVVSKFDDPKRIILIKNFTISLRNVYPKLIDLKCTDFIVDKKTINNIYVSTNYGDIIKYQLNNSKSISKLYSVDNASEANCMEACPFSPNYFLTGYSSGNIHLYSEMVDRPLNVLSNSENCVGKTSIQLLQWSRCRPFIIYTKDSSNVIHIWDLTQSDIFPVYSVPFEKPITCMKLSPVIKDDLTSQEKSFMLLGTEGGLIYLHILNAEHGSQVVEFYQKDVKTFLNYASRL